MSVAVENFIKLIFNNHLSGLEIIKPSMMAQKLDISHAAATDMSKNLAAKDLVIYKKYKGVRLTKKGKELALKVIRKHRLWETFLYRYFDLSLHEIHREAELLEHQTSDFMVHKLSELLGNPLFDPHGDPIPNHKGELHHKKNQVVLYLAFENTQYVIARLKSDEKPFFSFCDINKLSINQSIVVEKQFGNQQMTQIKCENKTLLLNKEFASKIYLIPKKDTTNK